MDQEATNAGDSGSDDSPREAADPAPGLSRRDFAARFGAGSAAAVGVAWATPHISTIKFARKVAVGSAPPASTTTTTTVPGQVNGTMTVSNNAPCAGDVLTVRANGFAPKTAVALQIDSAERTVGNTTAGSSGRIHLSILLPENAPVGDHELVVVGVRPGGRTVTLRAAIKIRSQADCAVGPEATTTTSSTTTTTNPTATTRPTSSTTTPSTTPTTTPPTSIAPDQHEQGKPPANGKGPSSGSGVLAFTGTDSVDLALLGAAAAVGGRALFGLVAHRDDEEDEDE